jgi:ABC-type branched-subunit amino acid transport system ATPase component/ABC-type branched-subunit amino acid transport system permease subunit
MNSGALVLGVLNGLTIGVLAVGLVLVYKSNKFLNLAHAQLGALSALLLAKLVLDWGWSWWVAFVLAVAIGVGTGVLVDRLIIARLRRTSSSPIRLLLLSIGVSQLLLALTYIPGVGPDPTKPTPYPQPFHPDLRIGGVTLTGMNLLTAVLVPLLVAGLAAFMRYSTLGKQIRAAANNPDAARLCGISVGRVSTVTWAMAGAFSAISAVLQGPTQASFNVASFGPNLLMLTLGAAAFGAFVSLPQTLGGGLVLGIAYQVVADIRSSGSDAQLVVFGLILLIVLVRGRAIGRVFETSGAVVEERPLLRVSDALRRRAVVRFQPLALAVTALVLGIVCPQLPYFHSSGNRFLLTLVLVYAIVGVSLTMLLGWGGQVSLGHFAIVGLGAYLTARWSPGLSLAGLILATGVIGALVMVLIGLPALRVRGLTLAVTTLGFGVIASEWLYLQSWLGTDQPFGVAAAAPSIGAGLGSPDSEVGVYYVALVVLVLGVAAAAALRRSSPGRLVLAVRDNERASAAFGVNPATTKLAILAVSGFFCGAAGVLWATAWETVSPTQFSANVSIAILAIPVIGGLGSIGGAVLAAVLLYGLTYFLGPHVSGLFGDVGQNLGFSLFLAGAGVVATLLRFPTGLAGAAQARWQSYLDRREVLEERERARAGDDVDLPLVVQGVHMRFGGIVALDEPDIVVRPGEIVGLIGTNGAGKTTLMNVISGVLRPDAGSVRVFGREMTDLAPDYRAAFGLSRSFQDASLFAGLTVRETIQVAIARRHKVGILSAMLGAPWVRRSEARTRAEADELIERFGLGAWADARTSELSTGSRRICDLAAQVAAGPKILLLDEPTAGVAQREAERFGPLLRQIRDELDCAVLIVEHDMPLLMGLCDRIYALETGAVIAEGTPEAIREDPRVVASYLGTEEAAISRSGAGSASKEPTNGNGAKRRPAPLSATKATATRRTS